MKRENSISEDKEMGIKDRKKRQIEKQFPKRSFSVLFVCSKFTFIFLNSWKREENLEEHGLLGSL